MAPEGPTIDQARLKHWLKNTSLIILSLLFLPIDTLVVLVSFGCDALFPCQRHFSQRSKHASAPQIPRTVLVTGVSMSKGLALARMFNRQGWIVIGADFSPLACGRSSRSLMQYYTVRRPDEHAGSALYIADLVDIVSKQNVDLWVSCSSVASAVEDGEAKETIEARTKCKAIQFDIKTTRMLHEKHTFLQRAASHGLHVPDTHFVTSRKMVKEALRTAPMSREYIVKPVGVDDSNRGNMTLLSKASLSEATVYLDGLDISEARPWILQQFIKGPEFCTHALLVRGQVKAFVACPSKELLMHYTALPEQSELFQTMLRFTKTFAEKEGTTFTGHLSFDFMVDNEDDSTNVVIHPIECNPRAHTAVVLFEDRPELVNAYESYLESSKTANAVDGLLIVPKSSTSVYWIGHDLVEFLLRVVWDALLGRDSTSSTATPGSNALTFVHHVTSWRDGTFLRGDPVPWWLLYHIYWPAQFLDALVSGKRWSRINVSTTKMFATD